MNDIPEAARIAGSIAGTVVSLAFIPPRTRSEAFARTAASWICGYIFGPYVLPHMVELGILPDRNGTLAATCVAAFLAWWALGFAVKMIRARIEAAAAKVEAGK